MERREGTALRVYTWCAVALLAVWGAAALWAVPWLIRRGYNEESFAPINAIFGGRGSHPVAHYLDAWRSEALVLTLVLLGATAAGYVALRWHRQLALLAGRILYSEPGLPAGFALLFVLGLGLAAGFADFLAWRARYLADRQFAGWSHPDTVWMAPVTLGVVFAVLTLPLVVAAARSGRRLSIRTIAFPLLVLGWFGAIRTLRLGLHPASVAVLAAGLGLITLQLLLRTGAATSRRMPRVSGSAALLVALLGLGMTGGRRARESWLARHLPDPAPGAANVLFIILDTVRARSLSLYGYERPTSPNLERLALRGVTFEHAIATSSWTLPSHASFFTGRHPHEHRADWLTPLDARYPTLAEFLAARGYATAAFVANLAYTTRASGLERGFMHYEDYGYRPAVWLSTTRLTEGIGTRISAAVYKREQLLRKRAPAVSREFVRWLDRKGDRPFFAFLNYFDAHMPYARHERFLARFSAIGVPDSVIGPANRRIRRDASSANAMNRYDSAIGFIDEQLGLLLDELARRALLDNTLIIVTSDHGEHFGERGLRYHGDSLYRPVLHVPLLIVAPRSGDRAGRPVRHEGTVSLRDLPATVVDILDLEQSAPFPGHSLMAGAGGDTVGWSDPVLSDLHPHPEDPHGPSLHGRVLSLMDGTLQYIRNGNGVEELYDLGMDASVAVDLSGNAAFQPQLQHLRQRLDQLIATGGEAITGQPDGF